VRNLRAPSILLWNDKHEGGVEMGRMCSRESSRRRNKASQPHSHSPQESCCLAFRAFVGNLGHIEMLHMPGHFDMTHMRIHRRTYCRCEALKVPSIDQRGFIEGCNCSRIPLTRHKTTCPEGPLAVRPTFRKSDDVLQEFCRKMNTFSEV
jgi:hypothetical protein